MHHSRLRLSLTLACLLPLSQAALAQSQSSVSIRNIKYTLTDLDLNDGIAPSLSWKSGTSTSGLHVSAQTGTEGSGSVSPIFQNILNKENTASGRLGSNTSLALQGHTASTDAQGLTATASTPMGQSWYDEAHFNGGFTLSPKTAVTFTADAQGAISGTVPKNAYLVVQPGGYQDNGYFDWAYIQASADAIISFDDISGSIIGTGEPNGLDVSLRSYQTASNANGKSITATLSNSTSLATQNQVTIRASVNGYTVVSVPEPSTWAQMLLGLTGLGGIARRSRTRRPQA